MPIPPQWNSLGFTSGRRTYKGNRLVGGVPNSDHLTGTAADFTASEAALRRQFGPNVKILNESDHRHVSGLSDVPFFGKQGIAGLVNGVDTSAPKGQPPMHRRPDPITAALTANYGAMSQPMGGMDPLAPQMPPQAQAMMPNMGGQTTDPQIAMQQQPNMAAMSQQGGMRDPLAPKPKAFGKGGAGWAILGALGDAMSAYGGRQGVFAPAMLNLQQQQSEEERFRQRLSAETQARQQALEAKRNEPEVITNTAGDRVRVYPDGRTEMVYMDPYGKPRTESKLNPATGGYEIYNTGSTPRPQSDDIDDLRRNPSLASDFDAEFGPGAAAYILRGGR